MNIEAISQIPVAAALKEGKKAADLLPSCVVVSSVTARCGDAPSSRLAGSQNLWPRHPLLFMRCLLEVLRMNENRVARARYRSDGKSRPAGRARKRGRPRGVELVPGVTRHRWVKVPRTRWYLCKHCQGVTQFATAFTAHSPKPNSSGSNSTRFHDAFQPLSMKSITSIFDS